MAGRVEVRPLEDTGDDRGHSWQLADGLGYLAKIEDIHLMTLDPGRSRGHHFHRDKHEVLLIEHEASWRLLWDEGPGEESRQRIFDGAGAVMILVPPGCSHAIENIGDRVMRLVTFSNRAHDRNLPDVFARPLSI